MARQATRKANAKAPDAEPVKPEPLAKKVRGKVAAAASEVKTKLATATTQDNNLGSKKRKVSGADEDDFHTLGRLNKQLDRAEKVDTKKKKQADVKTGVVSGITKSFAPAPVKKKKVVVF